MDTAKKVYVDVLVLVGKDGKKRPLGFEWEDGRKFLVNGPPSEVKQMPSLKAGGVGIRYKCNVQGKTVYLYDEEGRWFMEGR